MRALIRKNRDLLDFDIIRRHDELVALIAERRKAPAAGQTKREAEEEIHKADQELQSLRHRLRDYVMFEVTDGAKIQ